MSPNWQDSLQTVIERAQQVLAQLEQPDTTIESTPTSTEKEPLRASLPLPHPIIEEVKQIDLFSMTPLDALNRLADLQRRIGTIGHDDSEK